MSEYLVLAPPGKHISGSDAWFWADYLRDDELKNPPPPLVDFPVSEGGPGSGWFAPPKGTHRKGSQGGSAEAPPRIRTEDIAVNWGYIQSGKYVVYENRGVVTDEEQESVARTLRECIRDFFPGTRFESVTFEKMGNGSDFTRGHGDMVSGIPLLGSINFDVSKIRGTQNDPSRFKEHTYYMFDDKFEAVARHEFGHAIMDFYERETRKRLSSLVPSGAVSDTRLRGAPKTNRYYWTPISGKFVEEYGVTARARDDWGECVAENYVLYSIGRHDMMHRDMVAMFDTLKEWYKTSYGFREGGEGSGWFAPPRGTHRKGSQGGRTEEEERRERRLAQDAAVFVLFHSPGDRPSPEVEEFLDNLDFRQYETLHDWAKEQIPSLYRSEKNAEGTLAHNVSYERSAEFGLELDAIHAMLVNRIIEDLQRRTGGEMLGCIIISKDPGTSAVPMGKGVIRLSHYDAASHSFGWDRQKAHQHSMYYFDNYWEAAASHEYGHIWHQRHKDKLGVFSWLGEHEMLTASGHVVALDGADEYKRLSPTKRARDNYGEFIAECFALYMLGRQDVLDPDVVKKFKEIIGE